MAHDCVDLTGGEAATACGHGCPCAQANGRVMPKSHRNINSWPDGGFVRLRDILAPTGPLPISRSSWWAGVASGRYPKPVKLSPRITAWRVSDLFKLIDEAS
jgi:prophage regulatory protein